MDFISIKRYRDLRKLGIPALEAFNEIKSEIKLLQLTDARARRRALKKLETEKLKTAAEAAERASARFEKQQQLFHKAYPEFEAAYVLLVRVARRLQLAGDTVDRETVIRAGQLVSESLDFAKSIIPSGDITCFYKILNIPYLQGTGSN